MTRYMLPTLACLLLALPVSADDIILHDGTRITGAKVTSETVSAVKYTLKGTPKVIEPGTKVKTILREDIPEGFDNGQSYLLSGDYKSAILEFKAAAASGQGWLSEYAYLYLGDSLRLQGIRRKNNDTLSEAISAYSKVLSANAQSRFLIEVHLRRGVCYRLLRNYSQAEAAYTAAKSSASSSKAGPAWTHRASLGLGWTKLENNDAAGAKSIFESVSSAAAGSLPAIYREGLSGWSEAAAATGNASDVTTRMGSLKSKHSKDRAMMGVVHNGLGAAKFADKKYQEARLYFVKVVSVYFSDPNEHARALYYAARCYEELKEDASYASVYRRELRNRYPASTWALRLK